MLGWVRLVLGLGFKPRDASRRSSSILPTERLVEKKTFSFSYFIKSFYSLSKPKYQQNRCRLSHIFTTSFYLNIYFVKESETVFYIYNVSCPFLVGRLTIQYNRIFIVCLWLLFFFICVNILISVSFVVYTISFYLPVSRQFDLHLNG